jgi:hypothetical protein
MQLFTFNFGFRGRRGDDFQSRKDNHYYKGFSITENPPKEVYEPPSYLELCASFDLNQSTRVSTTDGKLAIDNAEYEDIEQKSIILKPL